LLLFAAGAISAQRAKPVFDPETRDGLLIQQIQQEKDPAEKLHYMEQFAAQYSSHPAAAWVYDQLQPAYFKAKEYEQAMRVGALRLALEPENLEAAKISLKAAEAKQDPEQLLKWSDRVWQAASRVAATGGANASEAKQTQTYAEYSIYALALRTTDLRARLELLHGLEQRNPSSPYVANLPTEYFQIYRQLGETERALSIAEKTLRSDPENVDLLMALAEHHFRKDDAREKVVTFTTKVIAILQTRQRPETLSESDWENKKSRILGSAYYMGGVSSGLLMTYARADSMLRAALPSLEGNEAGQATALYHLGLANYRLAEKGEASRAADALKFMRRCATIKSAFQEQAIKNVEAIKNEYSLQ